MSIQCSLQQKDMANRIIKTVVMVAIVIAVTVFLRTFVSAALFNDEANYVEYPFFVKPAASSSPAYQASSSEERRPGSIILKVDGPTRLIISSLGIDANVQRTGLNARGAMGVPTNFSDVAWYARGTVPGDEGSAVMAGHLDNGLGLSGVFKNLSKARIGDEADVRTMSGKTLKFVITDVREYAYDDPASSSIFDVDTGGQSLLRLITCGGRWLREHKTYEKRVVVTAALR